MTEPAGTVESTSSGADGMATPRSTVDVELVCVKWERNRYSGRNSWASREEVGGKGESGGDRKMILGKEILVDARTEWRVKWAQRGVGTFAFVGVLFYIVGTSISNDVLQISGIMCGGAGLMCVIVLIYKNISFVIMKRLFQEPSVIIILVLSLCNWAIEIGRPNDSLSSIYGFIYVLLVNSFVLTDAIMIKSRYLIIGFGIIFVALNVYELYGITFGDFDLGVVLVKYSIEGKQYTIMKRSTQRSIFLQVLLFSANGIYTTFMDKTMKLMAFATGNIYKSTGSGFEHIDGGNNDRITVLRRRSKMVLGKEIILDARAEWRVKWAQRGINLFSLVGAICFVVGSSISNSVVHIIALVCCGIGLIFFMVLLYKNISFVIMKRLFQEPNVIIIMVLSLCNWAITVGRPNNSMSSIHGFIYALLVNSFVLMDAIMIKSRYLIIGFGIIFVALNVYELYGITFGDFDLGVVLVKYSIEGKQYTIMKRSTQRSIFLQVLLFSANGIYTTFMDKTMKLMAFATGNIYKSTGTSSEEVENTRYDIFVK
eukprot:g13786.t1